MTSRSGFSNSTVRVGKYELGRTLGEGNFAKVKFARNTETGENVAIKILDKEKLLKHKMIGQIKREISTMKLIRHPNVIRLYEVMASRTKIYIVLEFVIGGELFDKIASKGRLKEDEARKYFQQLICAVDYCHSRGVFHRDLKIILTHEHADAVLGLDDIRAVQPYSPTNDIDPTPIYLSRHSMESIADKFPYLVHKKLKEGQEIRRVAQMDWKIIGDDIKQPFYASGLKFIPLPVMHGEDYICLGFLFGEKNKVAYISDVSRIPASTEYVISKTGAGQLDLLILDALYKTGSHNVHFCLPQALEAVKKLCPKQTLFIGMTHEFDYHKDNEYLMEWSKREGIPVQLARDGLRVPIDL